MGLNLSTIEMMIRLKKEYNIKGSVLTLGVQQISANYSQVKKLFQKNKCDFKTVLKDDRKLSGNLFSESPTAKEQKNLHPETLFKMFGFTNYSALDYFDNEGASIIHDLNITVPNNLHDVFDFVLDSGVTSHIANPLKVFENMTKMCKHNGKIMHILGIEGWCNHGFYSVSPCLLYEYYHANGFRHIKSYIMRIKVTNKKAEFAEYKYSNKQIDCYKRFYRNYILFIAKKETRVSCFQVPIQGAYLHKFSKQNERLSTLSQIKKQKLNFKLRSKQKLKTLMEDHNSRIIAPLLTKVKPLYHMYQCIRPSYEFTKL